MRLWFDDVRPAPEGWAWARTVEEAKTLLTKNTVSECSLDHDMGLHVLDPPTGDEGDYWELVLEIAHAATGPAETGVDLVDWMIEHDRVPPVVTIHSWNPAGAQRMAVRLSQAGYDCVVQPFREVR